MTQAKILMQGAKGMTTKLMGVIANHPKVKAINLTPEDVRSNWVIRGEVGRVLRLYLALVTQQQEGQLYISIVMLNGQIINAADAV